MFGAVCATAAAKRCLIEDLPLEQRVLTQNFRPTRVALEHWKALSSAAQQGIPEEPCIPGSLKRLFYSFRDI